MRVAPVDIGRHLQVTAETLESTYFRKVEASWEIPEACVAQVKDPAVKLLIPYLHYVSKMEPTDEDAGRCRCNLKSVLLRYWK